ncbi:MAG: hypothetical protein K2O70_09085 [Desulfovibrionaceae bacterium]|nr:hypothetical protein [Desulfovibrionaceae bacterium]
MRKEKTIVLTDRDRELTFRIREMPATRLESWIVRAGLLLASTGLLRGLSGAPDAGEVITAAGRAMAEEGLSALGRIDYEKARPLLDELLACCCRVDAGIEQRMTPDVADGIVEDVRTLFALRKEALALNLGFFAPAGASGPAEDAEQSPASSGRKISVRSRH